MTFNRYKLKKTGGHVVANILRWLVLIGFAYIVLYPFFFMAVNSIKTAKDWIDPTVEWIPKSFSPLNFVGATQVLDYTNVLKSTFVNMIVAALISFLSCALIGYGLARFNFIGKKFLLGVMIIMILIPDPMIMIASYDNFRHFDFLGIVKFIEDMSGYVIRPNLIDTPLVFWLPALLGTGLKNGLFIYIYTQFFKGLPKELEEAAWVDGAGPFKTFFRIVLPSSGSATITILVFSVVWYYNDYYQSQIYLSKDFPLSVRLANFNTYLSGLSAKYTLNQGALLLTSCFIAIVPLLVYFLILQRRFVQSI
ncbi:MAG: carbohydrate ABC transporter permease, partial [Clostridia bacterium]|nr:carbohydrate ABC transporter permease [Clostridia bacterium]